MSDTGQPVRGETAPEAKIGVFLLDDHEIVRRGVRELLEAEPDITVVGEAGTAASALARIPALRPDVAVLDVRLPDGDGVSVCREIRSRMPQVACLMLTSFGDDEALFDAIMAGAAGYVLKQIRGTDLVGAVRTVASGQSLLGPDAASRVMRRMRDQAGPADPLAAHAARMLRRPGTRADGVAERLAVSERLHRLLDHNRLCAPASDPPPHAAIRKNDCLIPRLAVDRGLKVHYGRGNKRLALH